LLNLANLSATLVLRMQNDLHYPRRHKRSLSATVNFMYYVNKSKVMVSRDRPRWPKGFRVG